MKTRFLALATAPAALGLVLAGLSGCGSKMAQSNPLGPVPVAAGSNALCPARYSFEPTTGDPSPILDWYWPTWMSGFSTKPVTDTQHVTCGLYSVKFSCHFDGSNGDGNAGVFQTYFANQEDNTGKVVTMNVYFSPTPPPQLGITTAFINPQNNPVPGPVWETMGYKQGWNQYRSDFTGSVVNQSDGFYLKFTGAVGTPWTGTIWVDDINW